MSGSGRHFNSSTLRGHYHSPRQQALSFLLTIGAKALVIEEQIYQYEQSHSASVSPTPSMDEGSGTDLTIDRNSLNSTSTLSAQRFSTERQRGINEEAEFRQKMLQQERVRSIRRRILEKGTLLVHKRGRNNKLRLIEITIVHEKKKETYIVWKSKLNRLKRVDIDQTTHVRVLKDDEDALDGPRTSSSSPSSSGQYPPSHSHRSPRNHHHYIDHLTHNTTLSNDSNYRYGNEVAVVSSSSSSRHFQGALLTSTSDRSTNHAHPLHVSSTSTNAYHMSYSHSSSASAATVLSAAGRPRPHSIAITHSPNTLTTTSNASVMPFVRFKNKHRQLDLQFQSMIELEAFLLVLQRFTSFDLELESLPISALANLRL